MGVLAAKSAGMFAILCDPNGIHDPVLSSFTNQHMQEFQGAIAKQGHQSMPLYGWTAQPAVCFLIMAVLFD